MSVLGLVLAAVGADRLDLLLRAQVTGVLGLTATGYRPLDRPLDRAAPDPGEAALPVEQIAATEAEPWVGRPMLRGAVHDEMAYALNGLAGHAGISVPPAIWPFWPRPC